MWIMWCWLSFSNLHTFGPYNNLADHSVFDYIGLSLFYLHNTDRVQYDVQFLCEDTDMHKDVVTGVQQSISENYKVTEKYITDDTNVDSTVVHVYKDLCFDHTLAFVTQPSSLLIVFHSSPVNMRDSQAYLSLVSDILSSGLPNQRAVCVPMPSAFK